MQTDLLNVLDFKADPTGAELSATAFQDAIDACYERGGGTVRVPSGTYVIAAVQMKSRVQLDLTPGSRLKGSDSLEDYRRDGRLMGMLFAEDAENIALTGHGTIDGNGSHFMQWDRWDRGEHYDSRFTRQGASYLSEVPSEDGPAAWEDRPGMMIVFMNCENVVINDITLADSPSWTLRMGSCDDVRIRGITIRNHLMIPNNDGIHLTSSRNVRISDCDIRAGDDAIAVTGFGHEVGGGRRRSSDSDRPRRGNQNPASENVVVTNCVLCSRSSAVRVGYGRNAIRNCLFQNLVICDSNRGLGVFARDAADIENLLFSDITIQTRLHTGHWWGNGEPIHVSAIRRHKDSEGLGKIRNVWFRNIVARSEAGVVLYGVEESPIEDVQFEGFQVCVIPGRHSAAVGGNFDLRPTAELRDAVFHHDIPGIYAQYLDRLVLRDVDVRWEPGLAEYHTYAFEGRFLNHLRIEGFQGESAFPDREPGALALHRAEGTTLRHCKAAVSQV